MKIGGFGKLCDYPKIAEAGFAYAELDIPELTALSYAEFIKLKADIAASIPVPIASRLLPYSTPLFFTPGFAPSSLEKYLEDAASRTAALGIKALILGNGKARSYLTPDDKNRSSILYETITLMAEIAAHCGQELILEPLGPRYSNCINNLKEAVEVIDKIGAPNLFTMADLRHMASSGEDFADLEKYLPYIHHLHIDYPLSYPQRLYPSLEDDYDYTGFLEAVKRAGYTDTITVEADVPQNWDESYQKIAKLLQAFEL